MTRKPVASEEDIRARIFSEHAMLRRGMATLSREAAGAQKGIAGAIGRLHDAVRDVRDAFERHLGYEERAFVPLLREADAWGPVRVTHLLDDHRQQRIVLVALVEDVTEGAKPIDELAEEIAWLIRSLQNDMDQEESKLLDSYALGTCSIVLDQTDG